MTPVLNMFLVLTGVSHQCHILWQHLSHHLQKIQQILWPPGNHPSLTSSPGYHCAGGVSIEILYLFSSNAFWTCELARLFVQINLQALWLFPAVVSVFHPLTPLWISVWVSNWSGSRGDMACICQLCGLAAICHISRSLWCLCIFTFPFFRPRVLLSQLISALPLACQGADKPFYGTSRKTKREIDIMYWALWQFLNVTPTWRTLFFLVEAGFMNGPEGSSERIVLYLFQKDFCIIWIFVWHTWPLDPQPAAN